MAITANPRKFSSRSSHHFIQRDGLRETCATFVSFSLLVGFAPGQPLQLLQDNQVKAGVIEPSGMATGVAAPASETIHTIREAWGFNMTELSQIVGVTRPTIYSWLKGKTSPDTQTQKHLQILAAAASDWAGATAGSNWDFLLDYTGPRADQTTIRETLQSADVSVTVIRELIHERMKQYQEAYAEARAILGEPVVVQGNPIHESTRKLNKRWAENAKKLHRLRNDTL
jgi:DNA-binding transcriptional regulator YiaG